MTARLAHALIGALIAAGCARATQQPPLAVGAAGHAFDHLGDIAEQAPAAAASGATVIYSTGVGGFGYLGLPPPQEFDAAKQHSIEYLARAKKNGVRLAIGYICATSIVKLETFDRNWTSEFRSQFSSARQWWLQQGRDGRPLPSWYGGDYRPACMNNPEWRIYEKYIVRQQLEAGHDGIFFDNPTVHPQGCYCNYCMRKFAAFVNRPGMNTDQARIFADKNTEAFLQFRGTIAADFLSDMRAYARTINPAAIITCNNSLNAPEAFFSQVRTYGYNIDELSKVEDLVVIEDMATQPRTLADGKTVVEYGPVYEMLRASSHGKPIVAVTLADGDYHTPPNLVRLGMAEAAAHGASNMWWPTWPENQRRRMTDAIRPEAQFLREHADLLNDTLPRADVTLALPYDQWLKTDNCPTLNMARGLAKENVQFQVAMDNHAPSADAAASLEDMLQMPSSVALEGPPTMRVVVRDQPSRRRTIVHLLNLNVQRLSSYDDRVTPAENIRLRVRCASPKRVRALSADAGATAGIIAFHMASEHERSFVELSVPKVVLSSVLVIEQ